MIPFRKTHVPRKYADPLEDGAKLELTVALQAAQQWRHSSAQLLVLAGSPGVGKSLAAAWALWDWWCCSAVRDPWGKLRAYDGRLWVAAPHLARLAPWDEQVTALEQPGALVLDDLGEEEATPRGLATISTLITTRFADGLATIVTTNLAQKTFRARYGERLIDRLRECGLQGGKAKWWITCSGESLRGRVLPGPVERPEPAELDDPPGEPVSPERVVQLLGSFGADP